MKPFVIRSDLKLAPFSHTTWFRCLIPKTNCLAEIFPTFLHLDEWGGKSFKTVFNLTGPVEGFTVVLDAEKEVVRVFGKAKEGFFRYLLFAQEDGVYFYLEKGPLPFPLKMKQKVLDVCAYNPEKQEERLSLGVHKKLDWELVLRRGDMAEIFPVWHRLGAHLPPCTKMPSKEDGNYALLEACRDAIARKEKLDVLPAFQNLFNATFSGLFVPHLNDPRFQGLSPFTDKFLSPLPLLKESSLLIRSLFFQEEKNKWHLLPLLPPDFHSGRFISEGIALEWTKKLLRRAIIQPKKSGKVMLILQKPIKSFRMRSEGSERGCIHLASEPLALEVGHTLYLDRFEK